MNGILADTLMLAVPLWQEQLQSEPLERLLKESKETAQILAERSDTLLFGEGKKGEVRDLFNRVARSMAIASFAVGGVDAFGRHWEAWHPEMPGYVCARCYTELEKPLFVRGRMSCERCTTADWDEPRTKRGTEKE